MTDSKNWQLEESAGATPEDHLAVLARQRKNSERYLAIRKYALMPLDQALAVDMELPGGHGSTVESFDAAADKLIEILAKAQS